MSALRGAAIKHGHGHEPGFQWRGREVSRLEGLSDAVFAFAITLLVISLEVPGTMKDLVESMRGFVGFIFSFTLLYRLWVTQYKFFRRYGLEDATTIRLNGVLLFMVLFFVYPLKFLTVTITRWIAEHSLHEMKPGMLSQSLTTADGRWVVLFYFWGSAAVVGTLSLMYRHAYRRRHALELTPHEAHRTRQAYQRLTLAASAAAIAPLGILTSYTPYATAGGLAEYVVIAGLVAGVIRMRRQNRTAPDMDEAYRAPDEATGGLVP